MLTISAFSSLAQLGSGLALALTIFVEPITIRESRCRRKLGDALKLIPRNGTEFAQDRENELLANLVKLNSAAKGAHELAAKPLFIIKLAAAINFLILIDATLAPDAEVNDFWMWTLLAACILPVVAGVAWLSLIGRTKMNVIETQIR